VAPSSSAACQQRVEELTGQVRQLDDERADLQEQRAALDLPALRTDFLHEILTNPAVAPKNSVGLAPVAVTARGA
jgi:hypothetical protein